MSRTLLVLILMAFCSQQAFADPEPLDESYEGPEAGPWKEGSYKLPGFPKEDDLVEFYVNATATAKYYIDRTSLSVGDEDRVVRYVMVVKAAGGATNTSFEGIRCDTNEMRLYATGTAQDTWAKSRKTEWQAFKIYNKAQRALSSNYFCPNHIAIRSADEGRNALKLGAHPLVTERYQ